MYIDTHCHLNFPQLMQDIDAVIERAQNESVNMLINVASDEKGSFDSVAIANKYSNIYASVGVHPHDASDVTNETIDKLTILAKENDKVVAIGEVGLDYFRNISPQDIQQQVFKRFILLSQELDLPLILHTRDADKDFLSILKETCMLPAKGVVHCFSGGKEFAEELLNLGFLLSFTGNITFKKANELRDVCQALPLEKMMIETDSPFLAPQIHRGKTNEPSYVIHVAKMLSTLHNCSIEEVAEITTNNAKNLFNL